MRPPSFTQHGADLSAGRYLRVVNYHNTPASRADQLERELRAYLDHHDPVDPDLDAFFDTGRWTSPRPGFVAAFYDGYRNNATVAAAVCDRLGLRAWFLPPTGFLSAPAADQAAFARANRIKLLPEELTQDRLAMTWDDLAALGDRHVVAAHTAGHAAAAEIVTPADARRARRAPGRSGAGHRPPAGGAGLAGRVAVPSGRPDEPGGARRRLPLRRVEHGRPAHRQALRGRTAPARVRGSGRTAAHAARRGRSSRGWRRSSPPGPRR